MIGGPCPSSVSAPRPTYRTVAVPACYPPLTHLGLNPVDCPPCLPCPYACLKGFSQPLSSGCLLGNVLELPFLPYQQPEEERQFLADGVWPLCHYPVVCNIPMSAAKAPLSSGSCQISFDRGGKGKVLMGCLPWGLVFPRGDGFRGLRPGIMGFYLSRTACLPISIV